MTPALLSNRREAARMIERARPGWMVIYGIYTRQYVAFPLFHAPSGTIVTASYPPALMTRMRRVEARIFRLSPHHSLPARAGHAAPHTFAVPVRKARAGGGPGPRPLPARPEQRARASPTHSAGYNELPGRIPAGKGSRS